MKALACFLVCILGLSVPIQSLAEPGQIETRTFKDDEGEHRYALFLPKDYSSEKKWPVILFLHGAGERGTDGKRQTTVGIGPVLRKRADSFPFVVVMPQCEDVRARYLGGWLYETRDAQRALAILKDVESKLSIDETRRVLTGWSMGGYGTWSVAGNTSEMWSAVVPLCGGAKDEWAPKLKDVPLWAFHGAEDAAIRPDRSRKMIAALRKAGGNPRYTEVTDGTHDITRIVYDNDTIIRWMLDPKAEVPTQLALRAESEFNNINKVSNEPFIPALHLKNAVSVRLGNRMLDALAVAAPGMVPKDMVKGRVDDIFDQTVVDGRNFNIRFGDVSYSANVNDVRIKAYKKDRVNIQVGLTKATLSIGWSTVTGRSHSATTGGIDIVIGHDRPAYISFDVTPFIEKGKLRLKLVGSRFDIQNDNWYVTQPAGVRTRGIGMTQSKVSNGLVDGLYGNKRRIENEVRAVIPALVQEFEKQLSLEAADELASGFWPLPVYKPRLRLFPEDVAVDEQGISLVLGVMAASIDAKSAPQTPTVLEATKLTADGVPKSEDLQIAIAPSILGQLSQLMIDADVARIHVLDIPENTFAPFADRAALTEAIPELARWDDAELWPELILSKPMTIHDGNSSGEFVFGLPELQIALSGRRDNEKSWTKIATVSIELGQGAKTELVTLDRDTQAIQLKWVGKPITKATGAFSPGYSAEDKTIKNEKLTALASTCWSSWTGLGPAAQSPVPDLEFGLAKLRLQEVVWSSPWLGATFGPAGVIITNSSKKTLRYETRGPNSSWGGPYTLAPGKTHHYKIAYPLTYRRKTDRGYETYMLAPGSHSEYRVPKTGGDPQLFRAREDLETGKIKPDLAKEQLTSK